MMNKEEFLGDRGFVKVSDDKYKRGNSGNIEQLDLDSMTAYVHDENNKFTSVPQELYDILKIIKRMEDMNQQSLDKWIEGLGKSKRQLSLSDFLED